MALVGYMVTFNDYLCHCHWARFVWISMQNMLLDLIEQQKNMHRTSSNQENWIEKSTHTAGKRSHWDIGSITQMRLQWAVRCLVCVWVPMCLRWKWVVHGYNETFEWASVYQTIGHCFQWTNQRLEFKTHRCICNFCLFSAEISAFYSKFHLPCSISPLHSIPICSYSRLFGCN